jgi:hypothetical protein
MSGGNAMAAKKTKKNAAREAARGKKSGQRVVLQLGKTGKLRIADIRKAVLAVRDQRALAAD